MSMVEQGFHIELSDQRYVMARLSKADLNMPDYNGLGVAWLHNTIEFEAAIYDLLEGTAEIPTSRLLHFRHSEQSQEALPLPLQEISGRQLMLFDVSKEETPRYFHDLSDDQKVGLFHFLIPRHQWEFLHLPDYRIKGIANQDV